MTFVTRISFQSGDRAVLDGLVSDLKEQAERKGAECKGPHQEQPEQVRAPQHTRLAPGDEFDPWEYTVYTRWLEIHGSDHVARTVADKEFPDSVHVEIEVEQRKRQGHHA